MPDERAQDKPQRKIVLIALPRADQFKVKQATNYLLHMPGDLVSLDVAQQMIDDGMTVVIVKS